MDRRTFMRIGLGTTAGAAFLPAALAQEIHRSKAKSVILLFMEGGPSQLDTFDPKPGADTGGEFKAIDTAVNGVRISEHLPRLAKEMKDLSIIRSMTSKEGDHARGQYLMHTGYMPEGAVTHPGIGCYVSHEMGGEKDALPNFIAIETPMFGSAFLKSEHAPYPVYDPGGPIHNIRYPEGVDVLRFNRRMDLLRGLEKQFEKTHNVPFVRNRLETYRQADKLMHTPDLRAFDLLEEEDKLRDDYGRNRFGQGCLLARRLVQKGVRFVEVGLGGWDTHENNFANVRGLCGVLDPAFATLIRDLRKHDLLKETLVLWMGEFGRTPRINRTNGRDHWPNSFSVALAGGGIQGGRVIGKTDRRGVDIIERRVSVQDYVATIYESLGIDTNKKFINESARPIRILDKGKPVSELF